MRSLLVDSGYLVALGLQTDPRHSAARMFLRGHRGKLLVPSPVIVEACYFLSAIGKVRLIDWIVSRPCDVIEIPASALPAIGATIARYSDLDPDFTDAAIVWAAGSTGCADILTTDRRDFTSFRINGRRRFKLVDWYDA